MPHRPYEREPGSEKGQLETGLLAGVDLATVFSVPFFAFFSTVVLADAALAPGFFAPVVFVGAAFLVDFFVADFLAETSAFLSTFSSVLFSAGVSFPVVGFFTAAGFLLVAISTSGLKLKGFTAPMLTVFAGIYKQYRSADKNSEALYSVGGRLVLRIHGTIG